MKPVCERICELQKTWKSGFQVVRTLFCEGYECEEVVVALKEAGYRAYSKEYRLGTPYLFVSMLPDEDSVMNYMIWWPRDDGQLSY